MKDDKAMIGGWAKIDGKVFMLIGQQKGKNTKMRQYRNFGMANPEGYRKALRLMKMAEKFNRPIVTFIDTPGAYPGLEAEERGQGEAIARNLIEMVQLKVPVICIIIGEGASGGALGIGIGDKVFITGQLGKSRQGLKDWNSKRETSFIRNFFYPKPKFEFAKIISDHATSCIDISDGLYSDLNQICFSSKVGAKIFIEKIPITYDLYDLTFGDDYELCFTAPDHSTQYLAEHGFYMIGEIDDSQKIEFYESNKKIDLKQKGWDPFA